ncbi:MAG: MATE family efflux transporter [Brevundimonas sp.]|uniref:MATE family efflux transporter n=1 Tax=Brevundimonas albigilva TaxID=1312364 RepID=UPI000DBBBD19|nr:MATE family efflux transporter [Brevundimonas albigilva]PZU56128.1 MAG: MATE family efflux transporter [Brevundimonas sp.]UQV18205.1 MATE family efflux transporter [Brevundimonas albigilva]
MSFLSPTSRTALRDLLALAWPVILARLGIMTMGLTDAIVVGNYSSRELAYHSLAWAPTSIVVTTAVGLMLGVQVMTARMLGEGRRHAVGAVLRRGMVYAVQIGVVSMIALIAVGPWGLGRIGLEDGLAQGAGPALVVFALSMPFYLISVAGQFFLEALGRPKPGMAAMWVANGVNLALNLVLVPDLLGVGFDGAFASAWATFGARAALAIFLVVYILRLPEARALGVFDKPERDPQGARDQVKVGLGAGASYFIEVGAFSGFTFFAGQIGAAETAAWAVVLNVSAIVFMIPMGLSSATAVLVGRSYGAGDGRGVLRAGLAGLGVVTALTFVVALVVWPSAHLIVGAYNRDAALLAIAAPALVLATLFFVADGVQVVAAQANRAAGDVWWPTIMHFTAYGAVMMPLGWVLARQMGVNGLVWAIIVASLTSSTLLAGRFVRIARRLPQGV